MSKNKMFSTASEPLTPAVFYILLSLSIKEKHGYEIMKEVHDTSKGKVKLGPGTLYGTIKRMLEEKLIREVKTNNISTERRKYYKLTLQGEKMLSTELKRFADALETAKKSSVNISLLKSGIYFF
jgi:DNA-binding PadR family transcriptional regulator